MSSGDDRVYSTDKFEPAAIETIDGGFERLGDRNTPFTLREASTDTIELKRRAAAIHSERPTKERRRDELRHEPITLDFEKWRENRDEFDIPGVDTIPAALRQRRADAAAEIAQSLFDIGTIQRGVEFADSSVRGRYFRGDGPVEIGASDGDFPGWQPGVTLAHEVGHGVDDHIEVKTGYASARGDLFENDIQLSEATRLSERLRGPMVQSEMPGVTDYRRHPTEKAADTFAAMIIEPQRSRELAPRVTKRFESVFTEFFELFSDRVKELDAAWMSRERRSSF